MKIYLKDLMNIMDVRTYPIRIETHEVNDLFLRRLEDVEGDISFYYGANDELRISYQLSGTMICPDVVTLEDVEVPFDLKEDEPVVHKEMNQFFL